MNNFVLDFFLILLWPCRIPIACSVHAGNRRCQQRMRIHFCVLRNPQKANHGCMSCVPYSLLRSRFPMLNNYGWWKASAPFLVSVGRRYVPPYQTPLMVIFYIPQRCTLCGDAGGTVIRCNDCVREYHISCAWRNGHRFGFEFQLASVPPFFITATLTQPSLLHLGPQSSS